MNDCILLVDDDPLVLDGYRRCLGREFSIETATGPNEALLLLEQKQTVAVVVSDMHMPGMSGIELLSKVKTLSPDTVRIILTGNAELQTAIDAINEGNIFRFLVKPCSREAMGKSLTAGLLQYRLVTAEKELLAQTLSGSIQVLTEVLSLVNPAAFGRAERARRYIRHVAKVMNLENSWQYEVAAMLSQLGCVTLLPETIEAVYQGRPLTPDQEAQYAAHPSVAYALLSKIPRLEPIAWMIQHQHRPVPKQDDPERAELRRGAEILRLVLAYEDAIHKGKSRHEAAHQLARLNPSVSSRFFEALVSLDPAAEEHAVRSCRIDELQSGLIIQQEVRTDDGLLVISKGQEVTPTVIFRLKNLQASFAIPSSLLVSAPNASISTAKAPSK